MSAVIVANGTPIPVACPSRLDRSTEQQVGFTRTLGGKRKGFVRPGGRRAWSIDVSLASPAEVETIETIARAGMQVGWYGPDAAIGNLLSPQAVDFRPPPPRGQDAGLVMLPDGRVALSARLREGQSYMILGTDRGREVVPVRPGMPLTVGAWALGGLRFTGVWLDAAGVQLGTFGTTIWEFEGWQWQEETVTPPIHAAGVELRLWKGLQFAAPSAAWGTVGRQQSGLGCPSAVIHSPSVSPLALWEGANYSDTSFTVTEVG